MRRGPVAPGGVVRGVISVLHRAGGSRRHVLAPALAVLAGCAAGIPAAEASRELDGALARAVEETGVARRMPDPGWILRRLDGTTFTLGDLRGRPVFVNFWATWCPPCVAELASIEALAAALADTDVAFVLVSSEDAGPVRTFARRYADDLPLVLEETLAPEAFGSLVLPTTAVLDESGALVLLHRGAEDWARPEVEALLRRLDRGNP